MYHPEAEEDETCIGNTLTQGGIPKRLSSLKTARLGEIAYDINRAKIDSAYMRPIIINKSDYDEYNRIMEAQLSSIRRGIS